MLQVEFSGSSESFQMQAMSNIGNCCCRPKYNLIALRFVKVFSNIKDVQYQIVPTMHATDYIKTKQQGPWLVVEQGGSVGWDGCFELVEGFKRQKYWLVIDKGWLVEMDVLKEFLETSTIHGVSHVSTSKVSVWLYLCISSHVSLLYMIHSVYEYIH